MCRNRKFITIVFMVLISTSQSFAASVRTVASSFNGSGDLLVDGNGDVYNANFGLSLSNANGTDIVRITPQGQVSQFATGFQGASGMALDAAGNIIQASINGNTISSVAPDGTVTTLASQGFNGPVGVAVDSNDQVFVANCRNNTISKIENGIGVRFSSGPLFQCPNGLTVDGNDNLYAVNFNNGAIIKIDPQGNATQLADSGGGNGHIVFGNDRLYFANHAFGQVFELSLAGNLKVIAGSGTAGHDDGDALDATFTALNGIGISPDGRTLYVNEPQAVGPAFSVNLNPNVLRAIELTDDDINGNEFSINSGLGGSWFEANTSGQGVLFDFAVADDRFDAVMYWFTYNNMATDDDTELDGFGSRQHRWFTALGPVQAGSAVVVMPIFRSAGGEFDLPVTTAVDVVGEAQVEFLNCFEATLTYQFTVPENIDGTINLQRLTPDINCETLAASGLKSFANYFD